jgi:DNA polymerase-3 subunit delta'
MRAALALGSAGARGFFSEMLDALTILLHQQLRESAERGDRAGAQGAGRAITAVEEAKQRASGNISPQLLGASLVRQLAEYLT